MARRAPVAALAALLLPAGAPQYDLAPGDHLVFRTDLVREGQGAPSWATRTEWESHVVVLARQGDLLAVGIQRNRRTPTCSGPPPATAVSASPRAWTRGRRFSRTRTGCTSMGGPRWRPRPCGRREAS